MNRVEDIESIRQVHCHEFLYPAGRRHRLRRKDYVSAAPYAIGVRPEGRLELPVQLSQSIFCGPVNARDPNQGFALVDMV